VVSKVVDQLTFSATPATQGMKFAILDGAVGTFDITPTAGTSAPEVDTDSAALPVAIVVGMLALVLDRHRRRA
jgi:hypothetical protein